MAAKVMIPSVDDSRRHREEILAKQKALRVRLDDEVVLMPHIEGG